MRHVRYSNRFSVNVIKSSAFTRRRRNAFRDVEAPVAEDMEDEDIDQNDDTDEDDFDDTDN